MSVETSVAERILSALKPYASNWNGTLGRGDLVIPQAEVPRLVRQIVDAVGDTLQPGGEAGDREIFLALMAARAASSIQDQVAELRRRFVILPR